MLNLPCSVGLGPLAGYTNHAYRVVSYRFGACFAYTEMISAKSVFKAPEVVKDMLPKGDEPFTGVQIYGAEANWMVKAALELQRYGKFIDVNAGCPVKKVVRKGMGGALLADLERLTGIVRALKENLDVPVTVKTRLGWEEDEAERVYTTLTEAGADMIVIHARTVKQAFRGRANWKSLSRIRERGAPLFVSGDIFTPQDALRALEESGADGVVVARGSIGNPWIFRQIRDLMEKGKYEEPGVEEKLSVMIEHLRMNVQELGERKGVVEFRKIVAGYTKGLPKAREFRSEFMKIESLEEALKLVKRFYGGIVIG